MYRYGRIEKAIKKAKKREETYEERAEKYCEICEVSTTCLLTMEAHKAGKRHRKAVTALKWETEEGCEAVEEEEEEEAEADVVAPDGDGKGRGRQLCEVCDLWLSSPKDMHIHKSGRKHKNLEEVKQLEGANRRLAEYNQQVYSERRM